MRVLLTGATGLLGSEILVRLCSRGEVDRIYCLARDRGGAPAAARVRAAFGFHGQPWPEGKIVVLEGELGQDQPAASLAAAGDASVIVHAAANTSFLPQNAAAIERANVRGLLQLLEWAKALPALNTFLHVGTAAVCGADARHCVIGEDDAAQFRPRQLLAYTDSKWRAEQLLRRHLPPERVLVVRPSILMGDSRGWAPRSPVVLWALAAINRLRLVPANAEASLDVVPVDFAAEAILRLLFAARRHGVYHVSSGPLACTNARLLSKTLSQYFEDLPPFEFLPRGEAWRLRRWIRGYREQEDWRTFEHYLLYWDGAFGTRTRALALLAALNPYFDFMELGQTFDNQRLASDTGLCTEAPAHVYLERCLEHVAHIDLLGGCSDP